MGGVHEECGVFGLYARKNLPAADLVMGGLLALQHRGQESCGIVVNNDGAFSAHKGLGFAGDVFSPGTLSSLGEGFAALGHVRYGTTGQTHCRNAQPIVVNHIKGAMALAHNGNLTNTYTLRKELEFQGAIFHTTSDTEVISYLITRSQLTAPSIEEAVYQAMERLEGASSLPPSFWRCGLPGGRPLCYGRREDGTYVISSESCALPAAGARLIRDVAPGEILVFDEYGVRSLTGRCATRPQATCIFEYLYFARPDSVIDGGSVHAARTRAGALLAQTCPAPADVVIGVPDGRGGGLCPSCRAALCHRLCEKLVVGRTFLSPGQRVRERLVDVKLSVISSAVRGKRVVLLDDSVVRGTTAAGIVGKLRATGAAEVHLRLTAPPFLAPCHYGTDIPNDRQFIAAHHTLEEVRDILGCDSLGYLPRACLGQLLGPGHQEGYCEACLGGVYAVGTPQVTGKDRFERKRSDGKG